jgi:putative peptidoglycan lipid II flippase
MPLLIRNILTVSTGTLASRLLGFVRDSMLAALLGTSAAAAAFLVAFQFIGIGRRLLSEGSLNAALVPAYLRIRAEQGDIEGAAYAGRVLGTMSAILIAIALATGLLMPLTITLLAPGFLGTPTHAMAVTDARLMLPYLAFVGPVTVMMGVLNAHRRFLLTAFSPVLFNVALILTMLVLLAFGWNDAADIALTISAAVGVAGCLQMLILIQRRPGRPGLATPLRVAADREMFGFLRKAIPGMVANAGPQLLIVAGAVVASAMDSAVSWIYFANRLIELPLGIVGVAMGSVLVPELSRAIRDGDHALLSHAQSRGLELSALLTLPATVGLIVLSEPIIRVLFEHGAFTANDTRETAMALMLLAAGLPAHVLMKVMSPAFFAREDMTTPHLATLVALIAAIGGAMWLAPHYGAAGVAAAIALAAWCTAIVVLTRGAMTFGFAIDAMAWRRLPRIGLAAVVMGGLLWWVAGLVPQPQHLIGQIIVLGGLIGVSFVSYCALLMICRVGSWRDVAGWLRD